MRSAIAARAPRPDPACSVPPAKIAGIDDSRARPRRPSPSAAPAAAVAGRPGLGSRRLRARRAGRRAARARRCCRRPRRSRVTSTIGTRTEKPSITPSGADQRLCRRLISAMSELVPPISTVIRSRLAGAARPPAPPITPAGGPDRNSRTGRWRATGDAASAAARLHHLQRRAHARLRRRPASMPPR